jgi:hypothetical protein
MEERPGFAGCALSEVDGPKQGFVRSSEGCAEVRADEAEREATTTILSLGFAVRPRAGCAFFSALRIARAWPGPRRVRIRRRRHVHPPWALVWSRGVARWFRWSLSVAD